MCIISDTINTVNSTKILIMPSKNGKRQLTVYSNSVSTPYSNVMCIPVPNPHSIRFESVPSDIFSQCNKSFKKSFNMTCMDYISTLCNSSYNAIIVRSINELNNQTGFILTYDVVEFLKTTYPTNGFILCKLKKGNHTYNPIAYSHDINNVLLVPTKQYHTTIKEEFTFDYIILKEKKGTIIANDWDHKMYSIATPIWCNECRNIIKNNKINWSKMPNDYYLDQTVNLNCYEKYGYHPNIDIEMPFTLSLIY